MPTSTDKRVALLGADSLAGTHLVPALEATGWSVEPAVDYRSDHPIRSTSKTYDPFDPSTIADVMDGCAAAIDAACWAPVGLSVRDARGEAVRRSRALITALETSGVVRTVYISDRATLGDDGVVDASSFHAPGGSTNAVIEAKAAMEAELYFGIGTGLDIPILLPAMLVGPGDQMGESKLVAGALRGDFPAIPGGNVDLVDVRDFARSAAQALSAGRSGRRYPISAGTMSVRKLIEALDERSGRDGPRVVSRPLDGSLARGLERGMAVLGKSIGLESALAHIRSGRVQDSKARGELSFVARPMRDTIFDAVDWYLEVFGWTQPN